MAPEIQNIERIIRDIPSMPTVAQKIMHMLGDPRTTNAALGDALASDQSMATRILQMANSPAFGTRQKISTVQNAIFILGHATLRGVIIAVVTKGLFKNPGLMEKKIWEHSLSTAIGSRILSETTGKMNPDDAFVGGLLHDIGKTMFCVVFKNDYLPIYNHFYEDMLEMDEVRALEREEFGYDHCEIGARTITKWRLPSVYSRIARRHHAATIALMEKEDDPAAIAIVGLANLISHRIGMGLKEPDKRIDIVNSVYNEMLEISKEDIMKAVQDTMKTYKEFSSEFNM